MTDPPEHFGRKATRAGASVLLGQAIRLGVRVVGVMVLARLLTPTDFGLVAMVTAVVGFLGLFREMGLITASVQAKDIDDAQLSTLFWLNLGLGLAAGVVVALLAPLLARGYGEPALTGIALGLALEHPIRGSCVQQRALLRRALRVPNEVGIEVLAALAGMGSAVILAAFGAGYWALVALPVVGAAVSAALLWHTTGYRPARPAWAPGVGPLVRFGASMAGASAIAYWSRNADRALLGWRWGAAPVGFYAKAFQIINLTAGQFTTGLWKAAVPTLSRLQDDRLRFSHYYRRILNAVLWGACVVAGAIAGAPDHIVHVGLGPQWSKAVPIVQIAALCVPAQATCALCGWVLTSMGRGGVLLRLFAFLTPAVVLVLWLGLEGGAQGVAWAFVLAQLLVVLPATLLVTRRWSPLTIRGVAGAVAWPLLGGVAAAAGAWGAARTLAPTPSVGGFVLAGFAAALAVAALLVLARPARREVLGLAGTIRQAFRRDREKGASA